MLCGNFFRFVFYSFELYIEKLPIQMRLIKLIIIIHCHRVPLVPIICHSGIWKKWYMVTQDDNFQTSTIVNSDAKNRILKSKLPLLIQFDYITVYIRPTIILFPMDNFGCTNTYGRGVY